MQIVYKDKNLVIINKPVGMPSQSDPTGDEDAMTATSVELRAMGESDGLWLVHRLDRTVGGLLAFARNKRTAAALSELVSGEGFGKEYLAVCRGESEGGHMQDLLYKDAAQGKAFVVGRERKGVKSAELIAEKIGLKDTESGKMTLLSVKLITGRFHQIRVQLASRGTPLVGDKKYGDTDRVAKTPALFSYKLSFSLFGKKINRVIFPNTENYPWCEFKEEISSIERREL
jgi:23S rRNA pseudouridine1911/1915/1917 synthase